MLIYMAFLMSKKYSLPDDIKSDESSHLLSVNRWTSMPAKITKPIPWMSFSGAGRL